MSGTFFDEFNAGLQDMGNVFGEEWTLERTGRTFPAIAIDQDSFTSRAMSGGRYVDVQTTVYISEEAYKESGVKKGDVITARETRRYTVDKIDKDGDAARTLLCGPTNVQIS